jgi:hypothetical protein
MSVALAALLIAAAPAPAVGADQAIAAYRSTFQPVAEIDCPRAAPGEVVVCARVVDKPDPNRPPLYGPTPGERTRLVAGEAPAASAGYGDGRYCFQRCPNMVGIDLGMAKKIVNGIADLIRGED